MIEIEDLVFEYPGQRALDGVNLHICTASVTALVGPNGAGKSTLLRCLAGLERPLSGRIHVNGIDVIEQPRLAHRHLGYLSDFFGLYERLTVAQALECAALAMGLGRAQARACVPQVAQALNLQALLMRQPTQLSRGQRQRLAIGQAIVHAPQVLLLDEPASGLDPEARADLAHLFRQLHAQGMTLLVSSHILSELDKYCSHLLALRDGRIESHAPLHVSQFTAPQMQLYALELAGAYPADSLRAQLQGFEVADWGDTGQALQLWLPSDAGARAQALAQWVRQGLPVAGLQPLRQSLQQLYHQAQEHSDAP